MRCVGFAKGFRAQAMAQGCDGLRAGLGPLARLFHLILFQVLLLSLFWLHRLQACAFTGGCAEARVQGWCAGDSSRLVLCSVHGS